MSELQLEFLDDDTVSLVEVEGGPSFELVVEEEVTVEALQFGVDLEFEGPPFYPVSGSGGVGTHVHTQSTPASTWIVNHNLGVPREPVILLDSDPDRPVWTDIEHGTVNQSTLIFPAPVTGKAYF